MKRKLLLADDSVTIQKVVNLTFADEGIDVITVGDGDSDGRDLLAWQRQLGNGLPSARGIASAVPEPVSAVVAIYTLAMAMLGRRVQKL